MPCVIHENVAYQTKCETSRILSSVLESLITSTFSFDLCRGFVFRYIQWLSGTNFNNSNNLAPIITKKSKCYSSVKSIIFMNVAKISRSWASCCLLKCCVQKKRVKDFCYQSKKRLLLIRGANSSEWTLQTHWVYLKVLYHLRYC